MAKRGLAPLGLVYFFGVAMYLETDKQLDVLHSMQEVWRQLQRDEKTFANLKWATIALCNALNSMLVCNLSGTMQVGALRQNDAVTEIQRLNNWEPIAEKKPKRAGPHDVCAGIV